MTDIKGLSPDELKDEFRRMGEPAYRAGQVFDWLHAKMAVDFSEMTNLSKALRERLAGQYSIARMEIREVQTSSDGTKKFLLSLPDANMIEAVLMPFNYGISLCVSSQAGCRMGCRFCASTLNGLSRSLTAAELLEEVYCIQRSENVRVERIVIMGCGEPFDNYDHVVRFLRLISDEKGQGLGLRHITVSTCGIVPGILRLAEEGLPVTLALSLHAPDDETRKKLMPVANRWDLAETIAACDAYFEATGRRVTYEYCLVEGVNDSPEHADRLARLLHGRNCHVNLISMNPVEERRDLKGSSGGEEAFKNRLEKGGINATIRKKMGRDIAGACGQLRNRFLEPSGES